MRRAIRLASMLLLAAFSPWGFALLLTARPAAAATYTWTGGGGIFSNWSDDANWESGAPAQNESDVDLVFPALAGAYLSNNDRIGLQVNSINVTTQVSDGPYTITGNPITLRGPITVASPGTGSTYLVVQMPLVLGDDVVVSTSGRQTRLQGSIDLQSHTLTFDAEGDVLLSGAVGGAGGIVKNGSSALTLSGANTYGGTTVGNSGALYINSAAALGGTATGTVINGGSLGFGGATFTTAEPLVFRGGGILAYGTPSISGAVTLDANVVARVFANAELTVGATISGSGGLEKREPGALVLAPPSADYSGPTTVAGGTLRLDGNLSATSSLTVMNGATLAGNGTSAAAIAVQSGGILAPGHSPGRLVAAGLTFSAGATLRAEIAGPSAGSEYDQVVVHGPVDLGGATLDLSLGYTPAAGDRFALITQQQDRAVVGTFGGLPEGANLQVDGVTFHITYLGTPGGDDVVLLVGAAPTPTDTPLSPVATNTPGQAATPSPTASAPPTPTGAPGSCAGDCDDSGAVEVAELVRAINVALGNLPLSVCPQSDLDGDARVTVAELIRAVSKALNGC